MRKTISSTLRSLLFFLAAGMFLFSCEENKEEVKPSSAASITSLTLTVGDTDYAITFEDRQDTITVPYATALPATATVKAVTLSAKATGVKVGDSVTIPVSGTVTLTVTAEDDKTTGVYTITVEKEAESNGNGCADSTLSLSSSTLPQAGESDVRARYALFTISASGTGSTEYYIALKEGTTSPSASDMSSRKTALTRTLEEGKSINVYIPFHIDGTLFDGGDQDYATAESTALQPETDYTLWAMCTDTTTIEKIGEVTTEALPTVGYPAKGTPDGITIAVRSGETFFGWVFMNSEDLAQVTIQNITGIKKNNITDYTYGNTAFDSLGQDSRGWFDTTDNVGYYYYTISATQDSMANNTNYLLADVIPTTQIITFDIQK